MLGFYLVYLVMVIKWWPLARQNSLRHERDIMTLL